MLDKIQIYAAILAAMAVLIVGIIEKLPLSSLTVRLIWVIILFYFAGLMIRNYLKTRVFTSDTEEQSREDGAKDDSDDEDDDE